MPRKILWLLSVAILACAAVHAQQSLQLDGYVTRAGTPEDFDLDGFHIFCSPATRTLRKDSSATVPATTGCQPHVYGEHLVIHGRGGKKTHIDATEISSPRSAEHTIEGLAIIDRILSPVLLRVDGFALQVTPETKLDWGPGLTPSSKAAVNEWVDYAGTRGSDGAVVASKLTFYTSVVTPGERKLRNKNEFNAAAVSDEDKQSGASMFFKGIDYKRLPAAHDPMQQQRIESIGARLIPVFQKSLAADDPNKINFRFQLVDGKFGYCVSLPNGIVLVPEHIAHRLDDDSQLAALIAGALAEVLEKQRYRFLPSGRAMTATDIAGAAAGIFVPGLGTAAAFGTGVASSKIQKQFEEQDCRMTLVLMHDAGFDIQQAPIAWWRLSGKPSSGDHDDYRQKPMPRRAAYLFQTLAVMWNPSSPLLSDAPAATAVEPETTHLGIEVLTSGSILD